MRLKVLTVRDGEHVDLGNTGMPGITGAHNLISVQHVSLSGPRGAMHGPGVLAVRIAVLVNEAAPDKPRMVAGPKPDRDPLINALVRSMVAGAGFTALPDAVVYALADLLAPYAPPGDD